MQARTSDYNIKEIERSILDQNTPITTVMRNLFYLRNIPTDESALSILKIIQSKHKSVLLKHEAAYVLGQMRNNKTIEGLLEILSNEDEHDITRHEAAESLGNFILKDEKDNYIIERLQKIHDQENLSIPIKESCYLAIKKLKEHKKLGVEVGGKYISPFNSYDPAYPSNMTETNKLEDIKKIYLSPDECLYKKYQAMFYLRNMNTKESVEILGEGFKDSSALFKHEIAFVFGQMKNEHSIKFLKEVLLDRTRNEHAMVRHEAAEALGAIGDEKCKKILEECLRSYSTSETSNYDFSKADREDMIVIESALVGLDIYEYISGNEDEYCKI